MYIKLQQSEEVESGKKKKKSSRMRQWQLQLLKIIEFLLGHYRLGQWPSVHTTNNTMLRS